MLIASFVPSACSPLELAPLAGEATVLLQTSSAEHYLAELLASCRLLDGLFQAIYVAGGHAPEINPTALATLTGAVVMIAHDPTFSAEAGGLTVLASHGLTEGLICDQGQTALKISWRGQRWYFPRCKDTLPLKFPPHPADFAFGQRAPLRSFLALSFQHVIHEVGAGVPDAVVFGLPCKVTAEGMLQGSSYAGLHRNPNILNEALLEAGIHQPKTFLYNDAHLTAIGALQDPRLDPFSKVLVLTIGTALGAAVIDRSSSIDQ